MTTSAWLQPEADVPAITAQEAPVAGDWTTSLPILHGRGVAVRELRLSDAPSLLAMLTTEEVARFISPPPTSVQGFERFIEWSQRERSAGRGVCLGIVPEGSDHAVGIIQLRSLDEGFRVGECGFAIGRAFWGTGLFVEAAQRTMSMAFETIGMHRIEARACIENGRGNGVLEKLGAVKEGWAHRTKAVWGCTIH